MEAGEKAVEAVAGGSFAVGAGVQGRIKLWVGPRTVPVRSA